MIYKILKCVAEHGNAENLPRSGRKPKRSKCSDSVLFLMVKRNRI